MKDILLVIFLVALGLFMLYRIFLLIRRDFIGVEGVKSNDVVYRKKENDSDDDLLIILDLDEEE